jgi:hypothetical protein
MGSTAILSNTFGVLSVKMAFGHSLLEESSQILQTHILK